MIFLKNSTEIARAIRDYSNENWKLCVAYVGENALCYLPNKNIEFLICNPNFKATNPYELEKINSVYFRDNLHTKIYLGSTVAIVGSANFSENGLSKEGTHECAVLIDDKTLLKEIEMLVLHHKSGSVLATPKSIKEMKTKHDLSKARGRNHITSGRVTRSFRYYIDNKIDINRFFPVWFLNYENERFNSDAAKLKNKMGIDEGIEALECTPDDEYTVRKNDFVLFWYRTLSNDRTPLANMKCGWYIAVDKPHSLLDIDPNYEIENENKYTHCLFCRVPEHDDVVPFELDSEFRQAFRNVLMKPEFLKWRTTPPSDDSYWSFREADTELISAIANEMK